MNFILAEASAAAPQFAAYVADASAQGAVAYGAWKVGNKIFHQGESIVEEAKEIGRNIKHALQDAEHVFQKGGRGKRQKLEQGTQSAPTKRVRDAANRISSGKTLTLKQPSSWRYSYGSQTREHPISLQTKNVAEEKVTNMSRNFGVPKTQTVTHRWVYDTDMTLLTASSHTKINKAVLANSIENPDGSSGENAALFSQYASFYDKYYVKSATIRVDFANWDQGGTAAAGQPLLLGIAVKDDSTYWTTNPGVFLAGDAIWKPVPEQGTTTLVATVKPASFFGSTAPMSDGDLHVAAAASGDSRPTNALYFHIWAQSMDGAAVAADQKVTFTAVIDYEVVWFEPRMVSKFDTADPQPATNMTLQPGE